MKAIKYLFLLSVLLLGALSWWMYDYATTPLSLSQPHRQITIAPHSSLKSIANQLVDQQVLSQPYGFIMLAKIFGKESSLHSGEYQVNPNITPYDLLFSLRNGKTTQASITFIEGHTFKQMLQRLNGNDAVKHTLKGVSQTKLMAMIDPAMKHPEGLFFLIRIFLIEIPVMLRF